MLAQHPVTLSGLAQIANARDGFSLTEDVSFDLIYNAKRRTVTIEASSTVGNSSLQELIDDVQAAVDVSLTASSAGKPGDISVAADQAGRIVFSLIKLSNFAICNDFNALLFKLFTSKIRNFFVFNR